MDWAFFQDWQQICEQILQKILECNKNSIIHEVASDCGSKMRSQIVDEAIMGHIWYSKCLGLNAKESESGYGVVPSQGKSEG